MSNNDDITMKWNGSMVIAITNIHIHINNTNSI